MAMASEKRIAGVREPIETPCVRVCEIDAASGLCKGCQRSLWEIAHWGAMPVADRRRIMDELPHRASAGCRKDDAV